MSTPPPVVGVRQGPSVIDLSVGTLSLLQHPLVLTQPSCGYSPLGGSPSLRAAVASFEGMPVDQVTITTGTMGALLTCLGLVDRRGEVLLPRPYFPAYPTLVTALGHTPSYYDVQREPVVVLDDVLGRVRPGTLAVFWNFPHNPTGRVDDGLDLSGLAQACADAGALLVTDRVYEDLVFGRERRREPLLPGEIRVKSLSKILGMAGERIGYVLADPQRSAQIAVRHWHLVSTPPAGSQSMVEAHMTGIDSTLHGVRREIEANVAVLDRYLEDVDTIRWSAPRAGMFAWLHTTMTSSQAVAVAAEYGLILLGGPVFGADDTLGFVRVNLGVDLATFEEGCVRLVDALA